MGFIDAIDKRIGTSFYVKYEEDTRKLSQLINIFSILLLVGTFLVGMAQNFTDHQVVIDGVKLLSYNAEYLHILGWGGSAIIGGCIVGLLGSFIHILFYKYNGIKYITNGFFFDAFAAILYGIFYFVIYMLKGQELFINIIVLTSIIAVISIITIMLFQLLRRNWNELFANRVE